MWWRQFSDICRLLSTQEEREPAYDYIVFHEITGGLME